MCSTMPTCLIEYESFLYDIVPKLCYTRDHLFIYVPTSETPHTLCEQWLPPSQVLKRDENIDKYLTIFQVY